MKHHQRLIAVASLGLVVLWGVGCAPPTTPAALHAKVEKKLAAGDVAGATTLVENALADPRFETQRAVIFQKWMELLVGNQHEEEARTFFIAKAAQDLELAQAGFDAVARPAAQRGDWPALQAWSRDVMAANPPSALYARAAMAHLECCVRTEDLPAAITLVPEIVRHVDHDDAARLLATMRQILTARPDTGPLADFAATMRLVATTDPAWLEMAALTDLAVDVARAQWAEARTRYDRIVREMPAPAGRRAFVQLWEGLVGAAQPDEADRLCADGLNLPPDRLPIRMEAAFRWLKTANEARQAPAVLARLRTILEAALPADFTLSMFRSGGYVILDVGDRASAKDLLPLADALLPRLSAADQKTLRQMIFDVAFIAEDYERVLAQLDEGLADHDATWHAMARNKILAHQALRDGRSGEAAERFRTFMKDVDAMWTDAEVDPSSGLRFTREMTLGFNARRIGDILAATGATNEASAAYAEALQFLATAKGKLLAGAPEFAYVTNELAKLPARP